MESRSKSKKYLDVREIVVMLLVFLIYVISGKLGLRLAFENESATAIWAPTGIALIIMLLGGYQYWPAIFFGALLVNLTTTWHVESSIFIAAGNTCEALVGGFLVNKFARGKYFLQRPKTFFRYIFFAGILSTAICATAGVSSISAYGLSDWNNFLPVWLTWWMGDSTSNLIIVPLLIAWYTNPKFKWNKIKFAEGFSLFSALAVIALVEFSPFTPIAEKHFPISFLIVPPCIWLAYRFTYRAVATGSFLFTAIALWGTLQSLGPFIVSTPNSSLLFLQSFVSILAITSLGFTVVVAERNRAAEIATRNERKLLESERQSREEFERLLAKLPAGAYTCDSEGLITYYNEQALAIWGRTPNLNAPEDRYCGSFKLLINNNPINHSECWMALALKEDRAFHGEEITIERPDGTLFTVLAHATPIHDSAGKLIGAVNVLVDITERKKLENSLKENRELLQSIIEGTTDAVFVKDKDGKYLLMNTAGAEVAGKPLSEVVGKYDREVFPPKVFEELRKHDLEIMNSGHWKTFEEKIMRNGSTNFFLSNKGPLLDKDGKPAGIIGIARNVTDRMAYELSLQKREEQFRTLFDTAGVGNALTDVRTGKFARVNQRFCELLKYNRVELLHRNFADITYPEDAKISRENFEKIVSGIKKEIKSEKRYICRDGSVVWVHETITGLGYDEGAPTHTLSVAEDITEKKRASKYLNIQYFISKALAESETFDEASEKVIQSLCEGVEWDIGIMWRIDKQNQNLGITALWSKYDIKLDNLPIADRNFKFEKGEGLPGEVWETGLPKWVDNISRKTNFPRARHFTQIGMHSAFAFPVKSDDQVIAIIECLRKDVSTNKEESLDVLIASGRQIGNFLGRKLAEEHRENARAKLRQAYGDLEEKIRQRTLELHEAVVNLKQEVEERKITQLQLEGKNRLVRLLQEIAAESNSSFDSEATLRFTLDKICEYTSWPLGHVYMLGSDGILQPTSIWNSGFSNEYINFRKVTENTPLPRGIGLPGRVLEGGKSLWIRDVTKDTNFPRNKAAVEIKVKAAFGVPLLIKEEVAGVLEFFAPEEQNPNEELLEAMHNIGIQLGRVIERTRTQESLHKSEKQLIEAQHIAKVGSWEWIIATNQVTWSKEMYRLFDAESYSIPTDYNSYLRQFLPPEDAEVLDRMTQELVQDQKPFNINFRANLPSGRKILRCEGQVEKDRKGNPVRMFGTMQDITELKEAEEKITLMYKQLKTAQKELIHSEKLASLGRFSSGIAHEIRNPLANISALAQIIAKYNLDKNMKEHLGYILKNVDIANKIIKDLLDFASPHEIEFELVPLNRILDNLENLVKARCKKNGIDIVRKSNGKIPMLMLNEKRLQTAFLNFISNSIDAMPSGGHITITTYADVENKEAIVKFEDTGKGIEEEDINKIFEPFFTTKSEGTGLGLSLAYQVIRAHQGKLNINSRAEKGTEIEVRLPIRADQ